MHIKTPEEYERANELLSQLLDEYWFGEENSQEREDFIVELQHSIMNYEAEHGDDLELSYADFLAATNSRSASDTVFDRCDFWSEEEVDREMARQSFQDYHEQNRWGEVTIIDFADDYDRDKEKDN